MSEQVGVDIEDTCTKCGEVWHVVVAKVGDKIAKVQCKICYGYHRYRSGKKTPTPRKRAATAKKSSTSRYSADAMKPEPVVEPDMNKPIRSYSAGDQFERGERVQHPKFGLGVVEGSPGAGKMFVMFPDDRRILAMAKPSTLLQRPTTQLTVTKETE